MTKLACKLTGAEEHELGRTLWLFFYFFVVITSYYVVKPVRTSLFLERLGAESLPYAYMGTALFVGGAVWAYSRLVDRLGRSGVVGFTWVACGLGLVAFWYAFRSPSLAASALFYFFVAIYSVLGVTQFWSFAADTVDSQQAKRTYGFIGSGGILGGLAGGSLTGWLAPRIGTEQLLLVSAAICFACAGLGVFLCRLYPSRDGAASVGEAAPAPEEASQGGMQLVLGSRYLLLIAGIVMCVQLVGTLVDFEFTTVVDSAFPEKDARTAFLGAFFAAMNFLGFVIQFFLTSPIQQTFGVGPALLLLPVLSVATSLGFFLFPVLGMAVALKLIDNSLGYSLSQATRELLYQPTSREVKFKAKAFIDMFVYRLGRCAAGILILAWGRPELARVQELSLLVAGIALAWVAVVAATRKEYVRQIRLALGAAPDPAVGPATLSRAERAELRTDMGFELTRYARALERVQARNGAGWRGTWGEQADRSRRRIYDLCARLFGASDFELAARFQDDERLRPLAQELLDNVTDATTGKQLLKALERHRTAAERAELSRLVLRRMGPLERRSAPRVSWSVQFAR